MKVVIRRGRHDDRPGMLEITRDVWEGNDYVPFVWDDWVRGGQGMLLVATEDGRLVGLQHAAVHPDNSVWLEGIRVRPDLHGRGVGRELLAAGLRWARDMGYETVRLSTSSRNGASNRLAEQAGLQPVTKFYPLSATPDETELTERVRLALPAELDAVCQRLDAVGATFYTQGWTAYRLTRERVGLLLGRNAIAVTGRDDIRALVIATANVARASLRLGLAAGESGGVREICRWLRRQSAAARYGPLRATVQGDDKILRAMESAGFEPLGDHVMVLWELRFKQSG